MVRLGSKRNYKEMGLNPRRRFGKETYNADTYWDKKSSAKVAAERLRKIGHTARVVKRKVKWPTEKKKTITYVVYSSRTRKHV